MLPYNSCFSPNSLLLGVLNALKNGRLGAGWSGRVSGWLVSHFLSYVSHFFSFVSLGACGRVCGWLVSHVHSFVSHFLSFASQFFSFVSQATSFHLSPTSFHCLPGWVWSGSGPVPGRLVSHFLSFVSHFFSFVSQAGCLWSGSRLACLPLPFICLPGSVGWVLVVGFPASLSPTSFHLSPTSFLLVVGFPAGLSPTSSYLSPTSFHLSPTSFHLSPRLGACGRVPGPLVSHLLSFVSRFFSFISQKCFICLPSPSCHVAFLFICLCHC